MVIAYLTGIGDLVNTLRSMGDISEYYLKSFVNLVDGHRRAFVVGGVAGHFRNAVLCEVLEDNRLPLILPTIDEELRAEVGVCSPWGWARMWVWVSSQLGAHSASKLRRAPRRLLVLVGEWWGDQLRGGDLQSRRIIT